MYKIHHGEILTIMGQLRLYKGKQLLMDLMGHLTQLMNEKKTNMHFRSLFIGCGSIIDITKKLLSLASVTAFAVFSNPFGVKIVFTGFVNVISEMRKVLNHKHYSSSQFRAINVILNQKTILVASYLYYSFFRSIKCVYLTNQVQFVLS